MNWPFNKLFENFSWTGRSNTKEVKQKVEKNTGRIQQAGRDIHNYSGNKSKNWPVLLIRSIGGASNQEGVSLRPEFHNDSNAILFIKSIDVLGSEFPFEISIPAQKSDITHLPSRQFPKSVKPDEILVYYSDTEGNTFCSRHVIKLVPSDRNDGTYTFGDIKFIPPIKPAKRRAGSI